MALQSFKRKIDQLRAQPEHVRLRAVTRFTAMSGLVMAAAWLAILLPLQLRLSWRSNDTSVEKTIVESLKDGPSANSAGDVSGAQDSASPTPDGETEYFQGTRPTLRQPTSPAPATAPAESTNGAQSSPIPSSPSPTPEEPSQPVELTP